MNTEKNIDILNSLELAKEKNVTAKYIVLECQNPECQRENRHWGINIIAGKISENDMICRYCSKEKEE